MNASTNAKVKKMQTKKTWKQKAVGTAKNHRSRMKELAHDEKSTAAANNQHSFSIAKLN